jgi:hypothetical protein
MTLLHCGQPSESLELARSRRRAASDRIPPGIVELLATIPTWMPPDRTLALIVLVLVTLLAPIGIARAETTEPNPGTSAGRAIHDAGADADAAATRPSAAAARDAQATLAAEVPPPEADPAPPAGAVPPSESPSDAAEEPSPPTDDRVDSPFTRWLDSLSLPTAKAWLTSEQGLFTLGRALLALFVFAMGWYAAHLASIGIHRLAERALADPRLATILHPDGERLDPSSSDPLTSPARLVSRVAYALMMLGLLLAVLHLGGLRQASSTLDRVATALAHALPLIGRALVILGACYVAGRFLARAVERLLDRLSLDARLSRWNARLSTLPPDPKSGEASPPGAGASGRPIAEQAGRITFWLIVAFGLAASIESLDFLPISRPIREALGRFVAFLPSLGAAVLILLGGVLLGRLARHVTRNLLESLGFDGVLRRLELSHTLDGRPASAAGGVVVMVIVIAQAAIAALDQLGLKTLSAPLSAVVTQIWATLPRLVVGAVILLVGLVLSRLASRWARGTFTRLRLDALMARIDLGGSRAYSPTRLATLAVRVLVLVMVAQQAFLAMELRAWADDAGALLNFLLRSAGLGLLIVVAGFALGRYVHDTIVSRSSTDSEVARWSASIARAGVLVFAFTTASQQVGIAERFVIIAFSFVFGALCLALALALGLGGRELAAELLERHFGETARSPSSASEPPGGAPTAAAAAPDPPTDNPPEPPADPNASSNS